MAARKPRPRTAARARAREQERLVRDLEQLASLEPGGSPERPMAIESPALVEPIANAHPCPLCRHTLRLEEHAVEDVDGDLLRVARVTCTNCGVGRRLWFRLEAPAIN